MDLQMGYMKSAYISLDAAFELRLLELFLPFGGYNVIRRKWIVWYDRI